MPKLSKEWLCPLIFIMLSSVARSAEVGVEYEVRIMPDSGIANVMLRLTQAKPGVEELAATFDGDHWFDFESNEGLTVSEDGFVWKVPALGGELRYSSRIDRLRDPAEYDSRLTPAWMITRAEDLFPAMSTRFMSGTEISATLEIEVPPSWSVVTPFSADGARFEIEQTHRVFDQPKGWLAAGHLDQLEEEIAGTHVVLAAPSKQNARLRDTLTLLRFTLPALAEAARQMPARIAIVVADDPMWRGGLAGPRSLYLHADRPLIEADGTSPLVHELLHVITHARSKPGYDWLVEGFAEYYSLEVLRRSGAVSEATHRGSLERMQARGASVEGFSGESTGPETALAVTLMRRIDEQIQQETSGESSLDDVLAQLVAERTELDRETLLDLIESTTGVDASEVLSAAPEAPSDQSSPPPSASDPRHARALGESNARASQCNGMSLPASSSARLIARSGLRCRPTPCVIDVRLLEPDADDPDHPRPA
jgi:hypothetical protein